jgi:hypothetical protein
MIALFDAYAGFGGSGPGQRRTVTAEDLAGEMSRLEIERALVRTAPEELDADAEASNEALLSACADRPAFAPCPIVLPNTAGDGPDEGAQIGRLLARGAAAVTIRPKTDYWLPAEWVAGRLFAELQARRVPMLCRAPEVPLAQVADLAGRFGELPILLAETGYR